MNHLVDEEVEDFRARTRSTLEDPTRAWPSLDPEAIVVSRRYQERDPREGLERLRAERARSLTWLRSLAAPRWEHARERPGGGTLRAGDLFSAWVAHDARHLAQIAKRLHALAARDGAPYSVAYAGWSPPRLRACHTDRAASAARSPPRRRAREPSAARPFGEV